MQINELNSGLIYTNTNCIGCNKCISGCIAVGANVVVKGQNKDRYIVKVDPNKCILCGHCIEECVHQARTYRDDTEAFFEALERGESISILVAPSLLTDYEKQYNNILGYLKHLGVKHIYNSSFGADIMVWVYMNLIHDFGLEGVISQFCPVIVNYLEKYKPELLMNLMPVQSPVMCTAIYVSDYLKIDDKLAYISPCIANKHEIEDVNTYGKVSYNVTFERLMKHISQFDITQYYAEDEVSYGLGALIAMAGGLSDNIELYIGFDQVLIQTSGHSNIFPYFDHYSKEVNENGELPFLVDALNCANGCNFGTATSCGVELRNEMTFSAHRTKERAYKSGIVPRGLNYEERLNMLNKRFANFEISSFVRQYGQTRRVSLTVPSEEKIEDIYQSMYKYSYEERNTDCGACGYKTCHDMACAVSMEINHIENCINYSKECIRRETEKTNQLLSEISTMNEELKNSAQLKSNFLANMSHEIRTPMNAVIGMAEMALRGKLPDEERDYIQQIKESGRSLLAIINDILDFSKIESGKMEISETEYTVMSIINDTVNIVMTRIADKDITLVVDADPEIPYGLYGDDIRIKQVLVNFANNAVKFTESGCVEISMNYERCVDGIYLTIGIRDTGIGIREEDMEKLFNSFQQVDSKRNRNIEGTGLGLTISREFVKLMGGEIEVESTYGVGSKFSFRIPQKVLEDKPSVGINKEKETKTASFIANKYVREGFIKAIAKFEIANKEYDSVEDLETAVNEGAEYIFIDYPLWNQTIEEYIKTVKQIQTVVIVDPRKDIVSSSYVRKLKQPVYSFNLAAVFNNKLSGNFGNESHDRDIRFEAPKAQILIVDDNAINLTVAKGLLSPFHMCITVSSGAREAITLIENNKYDIVFMDHMMPDIDGIEATHMIREKEGEYYKKLPIIALTANAVNNAKEMFIREGMSDFVAKPIEMLDITAKLKKWLPSHKIKSIAASDEDHDSVQETEKMEPLEIEGIDVKAGIALSGSAELYLKILSDYYSVIGKKADLIEQLEAENNIEAYTIEVHALKSASKLIGAMELSKKAERLEKCGHNNEIEPIKAETAELLRLYRAYLPILEPYGKSQKTSEDNEITEEQLQQKLSQLFEALDDFDIDAAVTLMEELKSCQLDELGNKKREELSEAVEEMEYEKAQEIIKEWQ